MLASQPGLFGRIWLGHCLCRRDWALRQFKGDDKAFKRAFAFALFPVLQGLSAVSMLYFNILSTYTESLFQCLLRSIGEMILISLGGQ